MPWGAAIGAAATIGGAMIGSSSAKKAANIQAQASDRATWEQQRQFEQTRSDMAPWRNAGKSGIQRLQEMAGLGTSASIDQNDPRVKALYDAGAADLDRQHRERFGAGIWDHPKVDVASRERQLAQIREDAINKVISQEPAPSAPSAEASQLLRKFTEDDFWADPVTKLSFQFGLDEGRKGLERAAPLTTGRDSGAMLKELTKWGTDYAGSKAGESYNRFENDKTSVFNKLAAIAGIGQTSANTVAQIGANTSSNIANLISGQGNAAAASRIAHGNAWGGALGNLANWWQQKAQMDAANRNNYWSGGSNSNANFGANANFGGQNLGQADYSGGFY